MNFTVIFNVLALGFLAAAAYVDWKEFRLPNLLLALAALSALGAKVLAGAPGEASLGNLGLGLAVWLVLAALKLFTELPLGAGDLKLLGVGVVASGYLSLVAMLACALVWALIWLALRPRDGGPRWKGIRVPLGPGLAAGILAALLLQPGQLAAQSRDPAPEAAIETLEFRDQPLPDIVRALGAASGQVFVVDETVDGRTSWYFPKGRLSDALSGFLIRNRLYLRPEGGVKEVTRVNLTVQPDGSITCDAEDVGLEAFFKVASRRAGKTVLLPPLPPSRFTVRGFQGTFEELLQVAAALVPDYQLKRFPQYFTFVRRDQPSVPMPGAPGIRLTRNGDLWNAEVSRTAFADVVRALAAEAGFEYSFVYRPDAVLDEARFVGKTLEELLDLLGQLAGADSVVRDGVRYFTQRNSKDVLQDLKTTEIAALKHLNVLDAANLLPPDLAGGGLYRTDRANNAFVLNGSAAQIETFRRFLAAVDKPLEGRRWVRVDLVRQRVKDVVAKFPQGTGPLAEALVLGEQNSLLVPVSEAGEPALRRLVAELDQTLALQTHTLKYLKAEDLLKRLPPTILKDELVDGGGSVVLFAGPRARFEQIRADIALVDQPRPQIRYQLLVIDYQKGESLALSTSHRVGSTGASDGTRALGQLAGILNLSLDVVSNFGLTFASSLSVKLARSQARVMADTTLQGLSGQDLKFQNTTTVRYVDTQIDPNTGKETTTGITRDLSSGLILALNGWVSGDGIITVAVNATISKLGDTGTSNRPTTSERVLSTQVRTASGTPLIIGGLQQRNDQATRTGLPWLTDLPWIGGFFDNKDDAKDATELTIYIVPFVDYGLDPAAETARFLDDARHKLAGRLEAAWNRQTGGWP